MSVGVIVRVSRSLLVLLLICVITIITFIDMIMIMNIIVIIIIINKIQSDASRMLVSIGLFYFVLGLFDSVH